MSIGADPEFVVWNSTREQYTPPYRIGIPDSLTEKVGADGAGNVGELRPAPRKTAKAFAKSVEATVKSLAEKIEIYEFERLLATTPSGNPPCGGHIHVDVPGTIPPYLFSNAMDSLISIPIACTLSESSLRGRKDAGYGELGSFRISGRSSSRSRIRRIEHRTSPSWLHLGFSGAMGIARVATALLSLNEDDLKEIGDIPDAVKQHWNDGDVDRLINVSQDLCHKFRFNKDLIALTRMFETHFDTADKVDIRTAWGIPVESIPDNDSATICTDRVSTGIEICKNTLVNIWPEFKDICDLIYLYGVGGHRCSEFTENCQGILYIWSNIDNDIYRDDSIFSRNSLHDGNYTNRMHNMNIRPLIKFRRYGTATQILEQNSKTITIGACSHLRALIADYISNTDNEPITVDDEIDNTAVRHFPAEHNHMPLTITRDMLINRNDVRPTDNETT
jgi:hypothetical protein